MAVYSRLLSRGDPVRGTWDYIDGEQRRQILVSATSLKDEWYADWRDSLTYRGINMGEAIKFPVFHFFWEALASTTVAESIFKIESPSKLVLSRIDGIPARYGLAARSDVPEAVFAYYADLNQIRTEFAGERGGSIKANAFNLLRKSLPDPLRQMGREMLGRISDRKGSAGRHEIQNLGEAIALLMEKPNRFKAVGASAYQSLLLVGSTAAYLEQTGDWSTLLLHTGDALDLEGMLSDPRTADFLGENRLERFRYLEIFKTSRPNLNAHRKFLKNVWSSFLKWQATYRGPYSQIFANRRLEFQFRYLLHDLIGELCRVVDSAYDVFKQAQPHVLLVGNVSEKDLTVAAVARAINIPSVLIPHNLGWASPEDYEYPVDYIAVQNEGTARFLKDIVGDRKLLVAGDLKRRKRSPAGSPAPNKDLKARTSILVLSGGFMPGIFQNCNQGTFHSSIQALLKEADRRSDWRVVFRLHPRLESLQVIKGVVEAANGFAEGRITLETSAVAEDLIPQMDLVVMLDYRSSPAVEAWRQGVPVISWTSAPLLYSLNDMFSEDWFPTVRTVAELERMIDRFRTDDDWRQSWIARGYDLTNNYFTAPELPESTFADMLTAICERTHHNEENILG
jgi:hypothetical protein